MRFGVADWGFEEREKNLPNPSQGGALRLCNNRTDRTNGADNWLAVVSVKVALFANVQKHFFIECCQQLIALLVVMQFGEVERITGGDCVFGVLVVGVFIVKCVV